MSKKSGGKVRCMCARPPSKHLPSLGEKPQPPLVNHHSRHNGVGRKKSKSGVFNFTLSRFACRTDLARLCRCVGIIKREQTKQSGAQLTAATRALKHMRSAVKANHFTFLPLGRSGGCGAGSAAIDGFSDAAR
jgi:hypothetical protein